MCEFIMHGILATTQDSYFFADDGGVSGKNTDGKSQATSSFKKSVYIYMYLILNTPAARFKRYEET
jgi:hypothetical protein